MTLIERFRRYGFAKLAETSGIAETTLREVARGDRRRTPWKVIRAVSPALRVTHDTLAREFRKAKEERRG